MTEEDTFKKLQKIPFVEMIENLNAVIREWNRVDRGYGRTIKEMGEDIKQTLENYLQSTGWNFEDFFEVSPDSGVVVWSERAHTFL